MSPINSLWFKWKSLRLPWRRSFLVGHDLAGNTYWEFKDALNAGRFRRIVRPRAKVHYADVEVSPQWHQWLRFVRPEPPSMQEQLADVERRKRILELAEMQRKRWDMLAAEQLQQAELGRPEMQQPAPATRTTDPTLNAAAEATDASGGAKSTVKEDPFFKHKGGPSEKWQPEAWTPTPSKR